MIHINPKINDEDLIGKKFNSKSCNNFTVIRKTNEKTYGDKGNYLFEIEFDEINGVKYKTNVRKEYILKRNIINPFYPSIFGIGYIGNTNTKDNLYEYYKWRNMLSRCYNPKNEKYKNYGAIGISVCKRWHCFEYFLQDFPKIKGYQYGIKQSLDKDIRANSKNKIYSLETCVLTSIEHNTKEMRSRVSPYFKAISPTGDKYISNCQMDFVRIYQLNKSCINDVLRGKQKQHRGWKFEYIDKGDVINDKN